MRLQYSDRSERAAGIPTSPQETKIGTINYGKLVYHANLGGMEVLVKVVLPSYGKGVHAHRAAQHVAPQVYGNSDFHDFASVVAVELLKDDWTTFFHYRENMHPSAGIPKRSQRASVEANARLLKR